MAARPRGQSGHVRAVGPSWVGRYRSYAMIAGEEVSIQKDKTIGSRATMSKTQAKLALAQWLNENVNSRSEIPLIPTLADIWAIYRERYDRASPGHRRAQLSLWRKHIEPEYGSTLVRDIDHRAIEKWIDAKPLSVESKDKIKGLLSQLLDRAVLEGAIKANPVHKTYIRFSRPAAADTLTEHEIRAICQRLGELDNLKFALFWKLGLSRSEARALRVDDVSMDGLRIDESNVEGRIGKTKTKRRHWVLPLTPSLMDALMRAAAGRDGSEWLFGALKGSGSWNAQAWLDDALRPAARDAGIAKKIDLRMLRRTAATGVLKGTNSAIAASGLLRNSVEIMAKHYADARQRDEVMAALTRWEDQVMRGGRQ